MLFGNTRIFVPEDTAGKVRGVSPVDRGRCCGRGSEKMRRHIYPNRLKGCFRNQYSQVFLRELQSGSGGDPQRVGGHPRFHQNRSRSVQVKRNHIIEALWDASLLGGLSLVSDLGSTIHQLPFTCLKVRPISRAAKFLMRGTHKARITIINPLRMPLARARSLFANCCASAIKVSPALTR
jgi:hypothetical protein